MNDADKDSFRELFGTKPIQTRGTQEGIILKYPYFYLKIYDSENHGSYIVQGYRYGEQMPYRVDEVPRNKMRTYASQFCNCQR